VSGGRVAAGVVVPSLDRVGRRFPLAAFVIGPDLPMPDKLDPWCGSAAAILKHAIAAATLPDDLLDALEAVPPPEGQGGGSDRMTLWQAGGAALPCLPDDPQQVLCDLFSCSGSSRP
jgi:type VI secretion system protein ImpM